MKMKYISRIQAGLRAFSRLDTRRAASRILDGSYNSIYKGRSMNFDELREYVAGDNIKDMDWKASARSGKLLVRQYIAEKKHDIMLVFDTNKRMLGDSKDGIEKKDIATMSSGTLAYMVNHQGDYIGATFFAENGVKHFPFKMDLINVELILQEYNKAVTMDNNSDLNDALEYIVRNFKRRMIIILVTDTTGIHRLSEVVLKRLLVRHDVLLINISDTDITGKNLYDLETGGYLPDFMTGSKKLTRHLTNERIRMEVEGMEKLKRLGIASSTFDCNDNMDTQIAELLSKHRYEKR